MGKIEVQYSPIDDLGEPPDEDVGREVAPGVWLVSVAAAMRSQKTGTGWHSPGVPVAILSYHLERGWDVELESGSLYAARPGFVRVEVVPSESGGEVTTGALRAVPLQDARQRVARIAERLGQLDAPDWVEAASDGRLTKPEHWAQFAAHYDRLVRSGERSPIARMARDLNVPRNTIAARVRLARDRGLLTRPTQDSPGELTEKARQLLPEKES